MPPLISQFPRRRLQPSTPSREFFQQWTHPSDAFSVLLILGGDVIGRALAQLVGTLVTPVAFSFGYVAFALTAAVSAVGENKLMPLPDCTCMVINGRTGYARQNCSWIIGRIVRDFDSWMDEGLPNKPIRSRLHAMLDQRWQIDQERARSIESDPEKVTRPLRTGLCVSIYSADHANPGYPGYDIVYRIGFATSILQLGIAAIPCGLYGDWGIILITGSGVFLSFAMGCIPQWSREKWACRLNSKKTVILTTGNGSQHAIVIMGDGKGLDLEDLATGPSTADIFISSWTRFAIILLAALWILLLITAAGIRENTWFLLAIGGIGSLQNIFVAGRRRSPKAFGVPLKFKRVMGELKVMDTLLAVEEAYPGLGKSMRPTFFPGELRQEEEAQWQRLEERAINVERS